METTIFALCRAYKQPESPRMRRTNGFARPHEPSSGLQQRAHVACSRTPCIKAFHFISCGHPPPAAVNAKAFRPGLCFIPCCIPVWSHEPLKARLCYGHHPFVVGDETSVQGRVGLVRISLLTSLSGNLGFRAHCYRAAGESEQDHYKCPDYEHASLSHRCLSRLLLGEKVRLLLIPKEESLFHRQAFFASGLVRPWLFEDAP